MVISESTIPGVPLSIAMLCGLSVLQRKPKHVDLCVGMRGKLLQNVPVVGMKVSVPCQKHKCPGAALSLWQGGMVKGEAITKKGFTKRVLQGTNPADSPSKRVPWWTNFKKCCIVCCLRGHSQWSLASWGPQAGLQWGTALINPLPKYIWPLNPLFST